MAPPEASGYYQVVSSLEGNDGTKSNVPYLLPPQFEYSKASHFSVSSVAIKHGVGGNTLCDNDDFSVTLKQQQDANNLHPVKVTLKNNNMWKCASSARSTLRQNFSQLYQTLDQHELQGKLIPGSAFWIVRAISQALPAPIRETLFYRYGMNYGIEGKSSPYIDLEPGMRLRVDFSANQFVSPSSQFNGLVPAGQYTYEINGHTGEDGLHRIAFNSFLGSIAAPQIDNGSTPPTIASGIIDLQAAGATRRYYRLFYPVEMAASNTPGDSNIAKNVTLVGADSLADMQLATDAYGQGNCVTGNSPKPIKYFIFRGRAAVVPEIQIYLAKWVWEGNYVFFDNLYVPVGTTVRNLGQRLAGGNPLQWANKVFFAAYRQILNDEISADKRTKINLNASNNGSNNNPLSSLDLPAVEGDRFEVQIS
ncbi:MAG: hypothetical protein F6J93_08605 [Oscillatoria sp. SIO1A7]|nr:hypothetical protein [Oscillatoria sp. SIO1A7]